MAIRMGRVLTLALAVSCQVGSSRAFAQAPTIVGVWAIQVTPRDCATTAPLGAPSRALFTFHEGGTLSESPTNPGFAPGQRSLGHGIWTSTGPLTYSSRIVAAIVFETPPTPPMSPGFLAGWLIGSQTATLIDLDHVSTTGQVQFYDVNRQLYRTACASGVGERFK
jgi:hypothetical protein